MKGEKLKINVIIIMRFKKLLFFIMNELIFFFIRILVSEVRYLKVGYVLYFIIFLES